MRRKHSGAVALNTGPCIPGLAHLHTVSQHPMIRLLAQLLFRHSPCRDRCCAAGCRAARCSATARAKALATATVRCVYVYGCLVLLIDGGCQLYMPGIDTSICHKFKRAAFTFCLLSCGTDCAFAIVPSRCLKVEPAYLHQLALACSSSGWCRPSTCGRGQHILWKQESLSSDSNMSDLQMAEGVYKVSCCWRGHSWLSHLDSAAALHPLLWTSLKHAHDVLEDV
jgi:hypothetical protein